MVGYNKGICTYLAFNLQSLLTTPPTPLNDAHHGGLLFLVWNLKYSKPPLSHEEQLNQLGQRGLMCTDRTESFHYLEHLNYYRLAAYWLPFEMDHASHTFRAGTTFQDSLNLYIFDRNAVSHTFDLDETNFGPLLHHLTTVRN